MIDKLFKSPQRLLALALVLAICSVSGVKAEPSYDLYERDMDLYERDMDMYERDEFYDEDFDEDVNLNKRGLTDFFNSGAMFMNNMKSNNMNGMGYGNNMNGMEGMGYGNNMNNMGGGYGGGMDYGGGMQQGGYGSGMQQGGYGGGMQQGGYGGGMYRRDDIEEEGHQRLQARSFFNDPFTDSFGQETSMFDNPSYNTLESTYFDDYDLSDSYLDNAFDNDIIFDDVYFDDINGGYSGDILPGSITGSPIPSSGRDIGYGSVRLPSDFEPALQSTPIRPRRRIDLPRSVSIVDSNLNTYTSFPMDPPGYPYDDVEDGVSYDPMHGPLGSPTGQSPGMRGYYEQLRQQLYASPANRGVEGPNALGSPFQEGRYGSNANALGSPFQEGRYGSGRAESLPSSPMTQDVPGSPRRNSGPPSTPQAQTRNMQGAPATPQNNNAFMTPQNNRAPSTPGAPLRNGGNGVGATPQSPTRGAAQVPGSPASPRTPMNQQVPGNPAAPMKGAPSGNTPPPGTPSKMGSSANGSGRAMSGPSSPKTPPNQILPSTPGAPKKRKRRGSGSGPSPKRRN